MEPKLRVDGASKIYEGKSGPVHALDDISLDVAEGELVTILGPSGCGKTTLLWAISGLHALTGGRITLDGTEVDGPRPQQTGMIFQDANLLPWRNLRQNIEFPFQIDGFTNHPLALLDPVFLSTPGSFWALLEEGGGVWGTPSESTVEKGEQFLEWGAASVVSLVRDMETMHDRIAPGYERFRQPRA